MNHLMPWCNLYLSELKFSLILQKSTLSRHAPQAIAGALALISFVILFFNGLHINLATIVAISIINAFLCYLTLFKWSINQLPSTAFILSDTGVISLSASVHYQLHSDSFIYPYGCCLSLKKVAASQLGSEVIASPPGRIEQKPEQMSTQHYIVFKDSLTTENYRRLCRIINKLKSHSSY